MTVFLCEGFETLGVKSDTGSTLESRLGTMQRMSFTERNGGLSGDIELIDDFQTEGLALQIPLGESARGAYVTFEWPSAFKYTCNGSHPVMVIGFRFYNADLTPNTEYKLLQYLTGATAVGATLEVAANGTDLVWDDSDPDATISSVLTLDTWHYIEVEFKPTTDTNGGSVTIYVDGSQVYNATNRKIVNFTFLSSWGLRIGGEFGGNVTSGQTAIDDLYCLEEDGVDDTGPLGASRVLLLSPSSDDTPNDWGRSTGSDNYALIDEQDWDTSDYVEATSNGDDDHYGLTTLNAVDSVHALQIDVVCEATDGTPNLHIGFDDGTADEVDVGTVSTGSESHFRELFEKDPSDADWSVSNVNSAEATQRMTE